MSSQYRKSSHVIYKCNYHIVWTPKYRFRILIGDLAQRMHSDIMMYCEWKGFDVIELNLQPDHVHLVVSVPPKVSISELMGTVKGKTAIKIFKTYPDLKKSPYWGNHFWARGYFVNTIGIDEATIIRYVKYQEEEERKEDGNNKEFTLF